jgi:recombination protein RecR
MELPETLKNAISELTKIPGVGAKTATRQIMSIARWEGHSLESLGSSLAALKNLATCSKCGFYTDSRLCQICNDKDRTESKSICVVEEVGDLIAIEKSGHFQGTYHVLGGVLNPLVGIGPAELNIPNLLARVKTEEVVEVILAVNPSVEGDATCSYINQEIDNNVNVERIGFGVPMGGSLEYLDSMTITKALENKKRLV